MHWLFVTVCAFATELVTGVVVGIIPENPANAFIMKFCHSLNPSSLSAWEHKFSTFEEEYLTVCLDDGSFASGCYSNRSFASSDIQI